jgi:RNA polymerase sigma-70 factor, ECF subfamily
VNASDGTSPLLDHLFRHQAGRITARLVRLLGPANFALAEEAVQEALVRALLTWPYEGAPDNPAGWLFRVAHNIAIDAVRRDRTFAAKTESVVAELTRSASFAAAEPDDGELQDDELRMIFMCCHPALARETSVALSLKTVGGFSTREIARAFLADERAIAQRLVRARRQIRDEQLTLEMPGASDLAARLDAVLEVIYFMFNEGYAAQSGEALIRQDFCFEALRLGTLVASAPLATPRAHALVALMALQAARLAARVDELGDLVLLDNQDRTRWDERLIALGFHHFDRSISGDDVSEYHIQAAIAAAHARATDASSVDWPAILELYDELLSKNPSPVVALNRAVAIARVHGPAAGLAAVTPLERDRYLRRYHLLLAVRGQLLLDLGRVPQAADAFRAALECECSEPERRFLTRQLQLCGA